MNVKNRSHRATTPINGFKNMSYEDRLKLIIKLEKRQLRGDLIQTFKVMNGRENVDKHEFSEISNIM